MSYMEIAPTFADADVIGLQEVKSFLYHEARLLDAGKFDSWLELFFDDGIYWVPSSARQTDPLEVPSIIYENKDLLSMRVSRLMHPRTYRTHPQPRTTHAICNVDVLDQDQESSVYRVASAMFVHEYCDERRRLFSGQCEHVLRKVEGRLRIQSKRVDLVDAGSTYAAFMIPF